MLKKDIKVRSSEGAEFDCYLVTPQTEQKVPAIVLASAIFGVDNDLRGIADDFASRGYIAAAPDLFWRSGPRPLVREDPRTAPRGQPRLEKIKAGERDLADLLPVLREQPLFNGRAAGVGVCYRRTHTVPGPNRPRHHPRLSCPGTRTPDYRHDLQ